MSSKYGQRMVRLSSKIFGEYRRPEMPAHLSKDRIYNNEARHAWVKFHYRNQVVIKKMSELPLDIDNQRNPNYYPPHPQHFYLINKLRELGLFRDEHLDFKEEIDRQRVLRGKPSRAKRRRKGEQ